MIRYTDLFLIALIPLFAGLLAIVTAKMRKVNTYSPVLAVGIMLVASGVVMEAAILALSVLSMVFGRGA